MQTSPLFRQNEHHSSLLPLPAHLARTLGICILGGHHLLLLGPRGTGKSHAMEWLIALQPEAEPRTQLEQALIGELRNLAPRAIRRIGPQTRPAALLGSVHQDHLRPGEFALSHGGLLVADEILEWPRDTREALREPLERGKTTLTRSQGAIEFDAKFTLIANGNLCPCGGWPDHLPRPNKSEMLTTPCTCTPQSKSSYIGRLSGPILDRIDMTVLLTAWKPGLEDSHANLSLPALREKIRCGRKVAATLWANRNVRSPLPGHLPPEILEDLLVQNPEWRLCLDRLRSRSLRDRHKLLRLALSIGIWDGTPEKIAWPTFVEAETYRADRLGLWTTAPT